MKPKQHATLGLFFLGVVGVLAWFTLFQSDFRVGGESRVATVWLEDAGGLRSGDPVLVAGVRWGKVDGVRYDARTEDLARRIQVDLVLDQDVTLFADHRIEVKDATAMAAAVNELLADPGALDRMRAGATEGLSALSGALERTVATLLSFLPDARLKRAS